MPDITLHDKLKMLRREIAMRRNVYPKRVLEKRMSQGEADHEVAVAEAILADYEAQARNTTQQALSL